MWQHTDMSPPERPLFAKSERGLISNLFTSVIIILYLHNVGKLCGMDVYEKREVLLRTSLRGLIKGRLQEMCCRIGREQGNCKRCGEVTQIGILFSGCSAQVFKCQYQQSCFNLLAPSHSLAHSVFTRVLSAGPGDQTQSGLTASPL